MRAVAQRKHAAESEGVGGQVAQGSTLHNNSTGEKNEALRARVRARAARTRDAGIQLYGAGMTG